jgi:hypothetical protein
MPDEQASNYPADVPRVMAGVLGAFWNVLKFCHGTRTKS